MRRILVCMLLVSAALPAAAAELQTKTVVAFERYVRETEQRMAAAGEPFLWIDRLAPDRRRAATDAMRRGEFFIEPVETLAGGRTIDVPGGLIHHWTGTVFVPERTVDQALALLQAYDRHAEIYAPNVARSKLLNRQDDRFRVSLRFFMQKVITVVVDSEHDAQFTRHAPDRASSRIYSTRITQVEDAGTAHERRLPVGRDDGYLWRLHSYWRILERDGGVYIQCESLTLTRGIPAGLGWIVRPFVTSIPRETLAFTLETTRKALLASKGHTPVARHSGSRSE